MLQSLSIKNAALISRLNLNFESGLNVLSGETGAGKSIIVDSLNFVLGSKADKTLIRHGTDSMSAEAVFYVGEELLSLPEFADAGIEEQTVILYRAFGTDSRGEIRINGRACTLTMLRAVTSKLVDVYGQSEHISLLSPAVQLHIIDDFMRAETTPIKRSLTELMSKLSAINSALGQLGGDSRERERLIELYSYQVAEIENAGLSTDEEQQLKARQNRYINLQRIKDDLKLCHTALSGEEFSAAALLGEATPPLQRAARYDGDLEQLVSRLDSAKLEIDDVAGSIQTYLYSQDYDEQDAANTDARLEIIKSLKRKYGATIEEILDFGNTARQQLDELSHSGELMEKYTAQKSKLLSDIYALSGELSRLRKQSAQQIKRLVTQQLKDLSMGGTEFEVLFSDFPPQEMAERYASAGGMDSVDFLIAPNAGQPLKPLAKIISGGEMSRFMLAVKNITRSTDNITTLVFDEIDTGISGDTATSVAKKFAAIARDCQVIAITHLPQIAAMGDANFLITKATEDGMTNTHVKRLDKAGTESEVARLIGAADLSEYAHLHAGKMLDWCAKYKKSII